MDIAIGFGLKKSRRLRKRSRQAKACCCGGGGRKQQAGRQQFVPNSQSARARTDVQQAHVAAAVVHQRHVAALAARKRRLEQRARLGLAQARARDVDADGARRLERARAQHVARDLGACAV